MSDLKLTETLEYRLLNAWPSLECQFYEGWAARFADKYTKRANSASPICPDAALDDALIEYISEQYIAVGQSPIFRLTGLEKAGTDELLAAKGFVEKDPSYCMLHSDLSQFETEDSITISSELTEEWLASSLKSQEKTEETVNITRSIVSRIRQNHGFATLVMDDQPVAWGLGVIERGYIGLYDVVVQPDLRGLGLGKRVLCGLMAWGRERGAQHAYLQVTEANEIARSLYASIGFTDAYRYHYRLKELEVAVVDDEEAAAEKSLPLVG
ncbi:GNAT family N-acetyltransferase [Microvirga sp. W0021]|uniref:GNAT family N-acetyltransferase n=1 Tax=Hohaiivirga grylli TaxID=3133970 RepID=A0ABV0BQ81_9HYPH